jgi:hypothetical protein
MNSTQKTILLSVCSMFFTRTLHGIDSVAITNPANSSTVTGSPLLINGTSSQMNTRVRLTLNANEIGSVTTNGSGTWNFTLNNLSNGSYTITADLMDSTYRLLATDTNSFTVHNGETITIATPTANDVIFLNPALATGFASLPSTTVNLSLDSALIATTTTDTSGAWQAAYTLASNGIHTLLAELIVLGSPVASATQNIIGALPVIFPSGKTSERVIKGDIPTTGSGSGPGYTYSVSGSIITLNFVPAFTTTPSIIVTGQRAAGSSTATVAAINATAASISFSTSTQRIHFAASVLQ